MQLTDPDQISYTVPVDQQPVGKPQGTFALHLPEARVTSLPITPTLIVRLVVGWLALLIILNTIAMHFVGQPRLDTTTPAKAGQMHVKIAADEERQTNIDSLSIYLQRYYDKFATYPSVSQINSIEFRKADPSFKVANFHTFMDPYGNTAQLSTQPAKNVYFYTPIPANCDSSKVSCTGYTIGATLDNGQLYTKHNIEQ